MERTLIDCNYEFEMFSPPWLSIYVHFSKRGVWKTKLRKKTSTWVHKGLR